MDIRKIQKSIGEQYGYVLRSDAYTDDSRKQVIAAMDDMVELTSQITGYTVAELKELVPDGRPTFDEALDATVRQYGDALAKLN
jgi:hypothetical protein